MKLVGHVVNEATHTYSGRFLTWTDEIYTCMQQNLLARQLALFV